MEMKRLLDEKKIAEADVIKRQILPFNRVTLWRLREAGKIGFLRIGGKIYYTERQLDEFLARCERNAKSACAVA